MDFIPSERIKKVGQICQEDVHEICFSKQAAKARRLQLERQSSTKNVRLQEKCTILNKSQKEDLSDPGKH